MTEVPGAIGPVQVLPAWLTTLETALPHVRPEDLRLFLPPAGSTHRRAAVLVLFGEDAHGPDLVFIERAATMRSHAGQPAFPGGAVDPGDDGPVSAALREAAEEVGLDPGSVVVLGVLPDLFLPPSGFVVTPVVAWWRDPHPVRAVDPAEVAAVVRVPLSRLVDPQHRVRVRHPSGWAGPGFETGDLLVWGFTAGVLDHLLALGGWEQPWDATRVRELEPEVVALARASSPAFADGAPPPASPRHDPSVLDPASQRSPAP